MKRVPILKTRTKNSIYYITINSNVIFDGSQEAIEKAKKFEQAVRQIFSPEMVFDFVKFKYPDYDNISYIPEIDINIALEIQSTEASRNLIHSHVLLAFRKHKTELQLDYRKIKGAVKELAELNHFPYLNSQLIRNLTTWDDLKNRILEYGEKYLVDNQEQ